MIVDTGALLALCDAGERDHGVVNAAFGTWAGALVPSSHVLTELDQLISARLGVRVVLAGLAELAGPGGTLAAADRTDLPRAAAVNDQSAQLNVAPGRRCAGGAGRSLRHRHHRHLGSPPLRGDAPSARRPEILP